MDEPEFEAFYQATADRLRTYLYRVCGDRRLAEDLAQEGYYRFLRSGFSSPEREENARYLFKIGGNLLKDHWAGVKRITAAAPAEEQAANPPADTMDVHAALGALKRPERQMLWLAYAEGYSHREIAGVLGVKPASVRVLLFRAKTRLLRLLQGDQT
jgi:RNA polymerase sigma-70 factor (ECF subfamily)